MRTRLGGLVFALTACAGCTLVPGLHVSESGSSDAYRLQEISPSVVRDQRLARASAGPAAKLAALQPASPGEYIVGPGDILSVVVWDHPELTNPTGEFRDPVSSGRLVSSDGTMFYPYAGSLKVGGRAIRDIRKDIAAALARIAKDPQVDVRVVAFRSQRIQVTGEVRQPGLVTLDDTPKGLLEAINERGGLSATASRRRALLQRDGVTYPVDLGGLLSGDRPVGNPALQANDVIHIPNLEADKVFVLGEVAKPMPVAIQQESMTLTEALTQAGGLDKLAASDSGVLVFRRAADSSPDSVPSVFRLDLSRPEGLLLAGEFELQPRDVVYVKTTAFAQYNLIINQLLPTISAIFQVDALVKAGQ